jgi:hypothetical protein
MTTTPQQLLRLARRVSIGGITTLTGWAGYKSKTDPVHLFWDLDHTILCSVTPLPTTTTTSAAIDDSDIREKDSSSNDKASSSSLLPSLIPTPPTLHHFDQIDDDFPYNKSTLEPNTRTYFRPGARTALYLCSKFAVCHVYTSAQESYTTNILNELDPTRELFKGFVLHRCDYPKIVKEGKDLTVVMMDRSNGGGGGDTNNINDDTREDYMNNNEDDEHAIRLERAILFDDKISNFIPQRYENGVSVIPFSLKRLNSCIGNNTSDNDDNNNISSSASTIGATVKNWTAYLDEIKEMSRLVGISLWATVHFSGDVRKVVGWVRKME